MMFGVKKFFGNILKKREKNCVVWQESDVRGRVVRREQKNGAPHAAAQVQNFEWWYAVREFYLRKAVADARGRRIDTRQEEKSVVPVSGRGGQARTEMTRRETSDATQAVKTVRREMPNESRPAKRGMRSEVGASAARGIRLDRRAFYSENDESAADELFAGLASLRGLNVAERSRGGNL